jgi:hypothetical protein
MTYPGIENDPASVEANPDRVAVEERRREREEEYSKYVAAQDIPWGNVNAYFEGEPVSTTTAERYGWLDLGYVKLKDAPAEEQQQEPAGGEPTTAQKVAAAAKSVKAGAATKDEEAK